MLVTVLLVAQTTLAVAQTPRVTVGGYLEAFYSWNANQPANAITALRGFDNRHNTLTLANAVLDLAAERGPVAARFALQVGHTPNTYYLAEPASAAQGGAGESDGRTWRLIQQANVGWKPAAGSRWLLEAGVFLSPIGHENLPARDNWNFSRSNLFYGVPFYHTGARATYALPGSVKLVGVVYNGWNSVTENNAGKSVALQAQVARGRLTGSALYFGGVERPRGAAEGGPWRHLLDSWAVLELSPRLSVAAHGDVGGEQGAFGTSSWLAAAAYARLRAAQRLYLAGRADWFRETVPTNASGTASSIFWPAGPNGRGRVASLIATADYRPAEGLSARLELRRDLANAAYFFRGNSPADPVTGLSVPNTSAQTTLTLGLITWF